MKKVYSNHHVVPTSRGGGNGKTTLLPKLFHAAWHVVFGNLYGDELLIFVSQVNRLLENDTITPAQLNKLREQIKERRTK